MLLLGLVTAGGLGLVVYVGFGSDAGGGTASAARPEVGGPEGPRSADASQRGPEEVPAPGSGRETPAGPGAQPADLTLGGPDPDQAAFGPGTAEIRGYIETVDETPFPQAWTLALEPSTTLVGRERVEPRVIEFSGGQREFRVPDLPLGGYDVIPRAEGMNGRRTPVLLSRAGQSPYITLQLYPAGFLEGRVVDHEGRPAEGLRITLRGAGLEAPRSTTTDFLGGYRFDGVLDGEYTLSFGDPRSPVLPPTSLVFSAPTLTVPERDLPQLSHLDLLVLDGEGNPVHGAKVEGSGASGGYVEVETDGEGRARAAFLPPGRYRLSATHEVLGRTRRSFEVDTEPTEGVLRFPPR